VAVDYGRLLTVFFSEAGGQLDKLNQCVLELEQQPERLELVDEIFRQAHSLKGGAASFGFHGISTLTHEFESYLLAVKRAEVAVTSSAVDTMLAALDALRTLIDHEARRPSDEDDEAAEAVRVREALQVVERLRDARQGAAGVEAAIDAVAPDDHEVEQAAVEAVAEGRRVVEVYVRFTEDLRMASVRTYLLFSNVERVGTILGTRPGRDDIDDATFDGKLVMTVALADEADVEALHGACDIDQVEQVLVEPFSASVPVEAPAPPVDVPVAVESAPPVVEPPPPAPRRGVDERLERVAALLAQGTDEFLRIDIAKVDALLHLASELASERNKLHRLFLEMRPSMAKKDARVFEELLDKQEQYLGHLRDDVMSIRMVPLRELFQRFPRIVRDLARLMDKQVILDMQGESTELDKKLVDQLADPLVHLLRNAVDHGVESPEDRRRAGKDPVGRLLLRAYHQGHATVIELSDDGRGIAPDLVRQRLVELGCVDEAAARSLSLDQVYAWLFRPGVSTRSTATEISGRGVGLDAVKAMVERLNGSVSLQSRPGAGTTVTIEVPLTLAMTEALLVGVGDEVYALPVGHVQSTRLDEEPSMLTVEGRGRYYELDERPVPLFDLGELLGSPQGDGPRDGRRPLSLVHVAFHRREAVLAVDAFIGQEAMIIKPLGEHWTDIDGVSGATIRGDGRVVLILDVPVVVGRRLHGVAGVDGAGAGR